MEFSFSHPQYLFLLFLIPLIFVIHFFSFNYKRKIALKFANFKAIANVQGVDFFSKNVVVLIISLLLVLSLVFSISGFTIHVLREATSFSFVLAIDSSSSMSANDLVPDRITAAKETAKLFVDQTAADTRIGVVSFSGGSYIEKELTENKNEVKKAIDEIQLNSPGGTDLFDGVFTSTNLLDSEKNKAIVLLSDGQINAGDDIETIIYYANQNNVIVNVIAMGTKTGGAMGSVLSKLDEDTLKSIAYNTGGTYFTAESGQELSTAFSQILQKTERKVAINFNNYLLLFAIFLFILIFFLINTRYMNFP
jgi:Ca-activated chloride channel homolog